MLACLGHDPVICCYAEQSKVDARSAGDHLANKAFVARYIHHAKKRSIRKGEAGKPQFNGDSPALFFCKAVWVGAGKRFNQCRFAVIDMAGSADDKGTFAFVMCHRDLQTNVSEQGSPRVLRRFLRSLRCS